MFRTHSSTNMVRAEMQMFLNDNGISSSAMVYDLARHLFEKVGYHGKHYSFSNKTHISRVGNEQIGSVLDVMRRYAREQGGMFVEEDLVQYLQNVGLKTGNLHGQMKLNEEPIFPLLSARCSDYWGKSATERCMVFQSAAGSG